jgi:hypothetical protein
MSRHIAQVPHFSNDGGTLRLYGPSASGYCYCMTVAWMLLLGSHLSAGAPSYSFTTEEYAVEMRVGASVPYEGKRLALYPPIPTVSWRSIENFVGAVTVVEFQVTRIVDGKPAYVSIREIVTLVDQSPGLPERPLYAMSVPLINGIGTDLQVFGYDESPLPASRRAAERETAKTAWRRYRQALYLGADRQPFAVIEWRHTTTRICILSVAAMAAGVQIAPSIPV